MSESKYRYPPVCEDIIEEIEADERIGPGLDERVFKHFRDSVVAFCAELLGKALRDLSHRQNKAGAELGRNTGWSRQAVHLWFTKGIYSFSGLILAISELDLEWEKLPCPSRTERTVHGYIAVTKFIREREFLSRVATPFGRDEWEILWEMASSMPEWQCAMAENDSPRLESLARRYTAAVETRLGRRSRLQRTHELQEVFEKWMSAFQLCLNTLPVTWLEI